MPNPATDITITIPATPERSCQVLIGDGVLTALGPRTAHALSCSAGPAHSGRAFVVMDDALPDAITEIAADSLRAAGFAVSTATVRAAETHKTLATVSDLLSAVARTRHERGDPIVALGGGVTGDSAGFVAAVYRRGTPVVQCPTTLLSMVDAAVGGKTGVNLRAGGGGADPLLKNAVGAFWQPALVIADVATLASLPDRRLRAGMSECIKHGLISGQADPGLFDWTASSLDGIRARDAGVLTRLVERNIRVKASFVAGDEREEKPSAQGGRALLNLGHTFAHAIETIPDLSPDGDPDNAPLMHGEAVALGLVAAAAASRSLGMLSREQEDRVRAAVERAGLPASVAGLPDDETIMRAMAHDKKAAAGRLRLVLLEGIGAGAVVENPPESAVRAGIGAIRS